jgi:hypothetical protein
MSKFLRAVSLADPYHSRSPAMLEIHLLYGAQAG